MFHESWWLDIVTRRRWSATEATEGGRTVGRMPIYVVHRLRGAEIIMPPLTHFLGPAIIEGAGSRQNQWLKRLAITRELVHQLPHAVKFWQKFHGGITDVIPFQAEKFGTDVQFTFEIEPAPEPVLWAALRDKHRNVIRRAQERYAVEELADSAEFARLYLDNLKARGHESWAPADLMTDLIAAAVERDAGTMLGVRDPAGELMAAVFCARDRRSSYYNFSTRRDDSGNGAIPLLIWESVCRAARAGLVFDFDGLSNSSSIQLFAGFGGITSPRFVATRSVQSDLMRLARNGLGLGASTFGA